MLKWFWNQTCFGKNQNQIYFFAKYHNNVCRNRDRGPIGFGIQPISQQCALYTCYATNTLKYSFCKLSPLSSKLPTLVSPHSHQTRWNLGQNIRMRNYFKNFEDQPLFWTKTPKVGFHFFQISSFNNFDHIFVSKINVTVPLRFKIC